MPSSCYYLPPSEHTGSRSSVILRRFPLAGFGSSPLRESASFEASCFQVASLEVALFEVASFEHSSLESLFFEASSFEAASLEGGRFEGGRIEGGILEEGSPTNATSSPLDKYELLSRGPDLVKEVGKGELIIVLGRTGLITVVGVKNTRRSLLSGSILAPSWLSADWGVVTVPKLWPTNERRRQ